MNNSRIEVKKQVRDMFNIERRNKINTGKETMAEACVSLYLEHSIEKHISYHVRDAVFVSAKSKITGGK